MNLFFVSRPTNTFSPDFVGKLPEIRSGELTAALRTSNYHAENGGCCLS